jgi:hypothetical protein
VNLDQLVAFASNKANFRTLTDYIDFTQRYLDFAAHGLQAVIVSQNENHYRFYQYREDGYFSITRPLNYSLFYAAEDSTVLTREFLDILKQIRDIPENDVVRRQIIVRAIYTIQQCIGATLDALPSGEANRARKINGDLFERLIRLLIVTLGVRCEAGTVQVPVKVDGEIQFYMSYQHDLLMMAEGNLKAIGSVKTSSKDRLGKIFMDKLLYQKLTDSVLPHIAIFLNDVQRKPARRENSYSISSTFLPGHFKGFTLKLNPLDGVYYCDIRPNMRTEPILKEHIQTIDYFFCTDLWRLIENQL